MILRALSVLWTSYAPQMANHLWQSTLFVVLAAILSFALRKNQGRVRYWVWLTASVKFLIPFSLLIALGSHLAKPRASTPAQAVVYSAVEDLSQPFAAEEMPMISEAAPSPAPVSRFHRLPPILVAVWLAGVVVVLLVWAAGWIRVSLMVRRAVPLEQGPEVEALRRLESSLVVHKPIRLVLSPDWMEPGIFGIFRPALIWPEGISQHLDDRHVEAILAHEICHARRRDNLTAVLHMLVEAVFWFHPLVWWMGARLEEERERACDEEVSLLCNQPHVYAESILKVCKFCSESPLACVSGITGADLKKRIVQIMTERCVCKLDLGRKLLLLAVGLGVAAVPIVLGQAQAARRMMLAAVASAPKPVRAWAAAHAMIELEQTPLTGLLAEVQGATEIPSDAKPFAFDVVSIRPADPNDHGRHGSQFTDDGFVVEGQSLEMMLMLQYPELQADSRRIVGGADWVRTLTWDIRAKVADSDISAWSKLNHDSSASAKKRRNATIRAMLTDRFKLKTHFETREGTVYALVVGKDGPKLKPSTSDAPARFTMHGQDHISFERTTVGSIMPFFAQELGHPAIDKTGLTGKYDMTLDWTPTQGAPAAPGGDAAQASDSAAPSLFTAVQEQLGLKLEAQKGPVEHLVIDSAVKPSVDGAEVQPPNADAAPSVDKTAAYVPTMTFDVASVRVASETNLRVMMGGQFTPHTTNLRLTWTIGSLLNIAHGVNSFQLVGVPNWTTVFAIEAKGDAEADTKMAALPIDEQRMEQQHMLQALLEERFKLKTHWETREGDTYNLVVAKGGPKLGAEGSIPPSAEELKNFGDHPVPPLRQKGDHGLPEWVGNACPMGDLASIMGAMFGRPVIDKTGLAGKYDFVLKYKGRWDSDSNADDMEPTPPLDRALQEELGLKVESAKGPVKVLVIDHIEKPSEN